MPKWLIWKMTLLIPNFDPIPHRKLKGTKTVNCIKNGQTHTHIQAHTHMIIFTEVINIYSVCTWSKSLKYSNYDKKVQIR